MDVNGVALVMVDVQNDFCPGGALPVSEGDRIVRALNFLTEHIHFVVATRDWHPQETSHFKEFGGVWPVHCVQGTPGAEFHSKLKIGNANIFSKGTKPDEDGYSGFDGVNEAGVSLEDFLKEYEIDTLVVGGLATDYCVKATVLDAIQRGFEVVVVVDAIRAVNIHAEDGMNALQEMRKAGAYISALRNVFGFLS